MIGKTDLVALPSEGDNIYNELVKNEKNEGRITKIEL